MNAPKIPTEGGSYTRQDDGSLELVNQTEPAPAPENRKSPDDPHPEPETPAPVMPVPDQHTEEK